jgi:hypothetical protein
VDVLGIKKPPVISMFQDNKNGLSNDNIESLNKINGETSFWKG